jgi:putative membrane protein
MIKRYSDHAADERTLLAWVRTAIAVMAFGFVIERFDLFLKYAAPPAAQGMIAPHGGAFANAGGLAFIVLGVVIIMIAGRRFVRTPRTSTARRGWRAPASASMSRWREWSGLAPRRFFT